MKSAFSIISFVGRSGSGKGTQAKLLREKTGFEIIGTGDLLRQRAKKHDAVGRTIAATLKKGGLIPTPIVFSLWMPRLERVKNTKGTKGIIFDGNPRKLYEAHMLDELFLMFGWEKRFRACHIAISQAEARKRLLARGRTDDTPERIKERLDYFPKEVEPMLTYYKKKGVLIELNGTQSEQGVHQELMRKLRGFLK